MLETTAPSHKPPILDSASFLSSRQTQDILQASLEPSMFCTPVSFSLWPCLLQEKSKIAPSACVLYCAMPIWLHFWFNLFPAFSKRVYILMWTRARVGLGINRTWFKHHHPWAWNSLCDFGPVRHSNCAYFTRLLRGQDEIGERVKTMWTILISLEVSYGINRFQAVSLFIYKYLYEWVAFF